MTPEVYTSCAGVGRPVVQVVVFSPSPGPHKVGGDGTGECSVCGRVVSQRAGIAKRHKDKRPAPGERVPEKED